MPSLPARIKKILSKMKALEWSQNFPHYDHMGAIYCHGNQSSDPIWPKTYCSLSPTPMMLQLNLIATGSLVAKIFTFESVDRQTDRRTDGRRLDWYTTCISSPCDPSAQVTYKTKRTTFCILCKRFLNILFRMARRVTNRLVRNAIVNGSFCDCNKGGSFLNKIPYVLFSQE